MANSQAPGQTEARLRADWASGTLEPAVVEAIEGLSRQLDTLDTPLGLPLAYYGEACDAPDGGPSPPSQDVRDKMALIARGSCLFVDKLRNAAAMGAAGALVYSQRYPDHSDDGGMRNPGIHLFRPARGHDGP